MYKRDLLLFVTLLHVVFGGKNIGDFCTVNEKLGQCKLFANCPLAGENLKKHGIGPKICGFQKRQPVVCCPRLPGELSQQKCREYSKYANKTFTSPVLLFDAPVISKYECGHEIVPLIIGGELAKSGEFPHMASVGFGTGSEEIDWNCGGTIISERYILTAAHCLSHRHHGNATFVRVGVNNLKFSENGQTIRIKERIAHPDYKYPSRYNDIGLIKLEEDIKLNSLVRPACLYTKTKISATKVIATGWGITSLLDAESKSDDLRKVILKLVNVDSCIDVYPQSRKLEMGILEESQLCVDGTSSMDTCSGDSGGPLQIYHSEDDARCMYDVVGITSFGRFCGAVVGVYTRISNYVEWIENQVWLSKETNFST